MNNGIFSDIEKNTGHHTSKVLAEALINVIDSKVPVYDFGCGNGFYTDFINNKRIKCIGFDGNPTKENNTIKKYDITTPLLLQDNGTILCLEVAEHIPAEKRKIFIENIVNNCKNRIILSWALPGQGGMGHVSEMDNVDVMQLFAKYKFNINYVETQYLRRSVSSCNCWWFRTTLMVFDKK